MWSNLSDAELIVLYHCFTPEAANELTTADMTIAYKMFSEIVSEIRKRKLRVI